MSVRRKFLRSAEFAQPLIDLEQFLHEVGMSDWAYTVEDIRALLKEDRALALRRLTGGEFWGGSGSFMDLYISGPYSAEQRDIYNRRYNGLLLQILLNLGKLGYRIPEGTEEFLRHNS